MEIFVSGNELRVGEQKYPCSIGRNGYSKFKREGDGCTPIGSFNFREVFYRADRIDAPSTSLPSRAITSVDGWCDAPDDENITNMFICLTPQAMKSCGVKIGYMT